MPALPTLPPYNVISKGDWYNIGDRKTNPLGRPIKCSCHYCDSVTLDICTKCDSVTPMPSTTVLTIKQLHDDTGALVRRAGALKRPVPITDRGQEVAVLVNRSLLRPLNRKRTVLPEYEAMMAEAPGDTIQAALDEIRGDR